MLLNLFVNAAHAISEKCDTGPGVPKTLRARIFDPFFTTKGVGKGTGQGLSICQDIVVKKHGGKFFLDETVETGATFVVRLPISPL